MAGAIEIEDYRDLAGATASESDGNMTREQVLSLMKQKDEYEAELAAMAEVLKTQGCGMDEELVDADGFPRADIDVYQVGSCTVLYCWAALCLLSYTVILGAARPARHQD